MKNSGQLSRRGLLAAAGFAGLAALTGCGGGSEDDGGSADLSKKRAGAMEKYGVGDQFLAASALTFPVLHNNMPNYPMKDSWLFWKEVTKRTNVTFKPTAVPNSDYEKKRSLMIGAGDAPWIIPKTYHPQEAAFVSSGAVLPVSEYTHLMPNFTAKVKAWGLAGELDSIRQSDGRFYLLPGLHEKPKPGYSLALRTDVLERLGLALPGTWDEVREVLRALRREYPDRYPFSDRWSVPTYPAGSLLKYLSRAYGTKGGWDYENVTFDAGAGEFVFTGAMDQYRQMLDFLHSLCAEKLLDPESFTQSDDEAVRKLLSEKSFVISSNPQELVQNYRYNLARQVRGATVEMIPMPVGPAGEVMADGRLENGVMIAAAALRSDHFVALMQFVDWLWYSDAGLEFSKYGVEGVTYTRTGPGRYRVADGIGLMGTPADAPKDLQKDFGFSNGVFAYGGSRALVSSSFAADERKFQEAMAGWRLLPVEPAHPLRAEEQEQAVLWETPLKDHVAQNTMKFALGKRPLSEWDTYLGELKSKNMERYVDLHNKAHERFRREKG
ncbi:extracellular solute-binding protein [Streptomyces sp. NPDC093109]|uniref:ABC transporter substrate-binding protein n=1 Tax=Streptomyces sp. NPDC093109 TaxID=3154977 RepID=UPI00344F56ED